MSSRRKKAAVASVAVVAAAAAGQLIRPQHTNPASDPTHSIRSRLGASSALPPVLDRSCGDCHSNATEWRWYTQVAPLSWIMASAVRKGREVVNFSEWTAYSPEQRRSLLVLSCLDATNRKMPIGAYLRFRPDAQLSPNDIETICAASRELESTVVSNSDSPRY